MLTIPFAAKGNVKRRILRPFYARAIFVQSLSILSFPQYHRPRDFCFRCSSRRNVVDSLDIYESIIHISFRYTEVLLIIPMSVSEEFLEFSWHRKNDSVRTRSLRCRLCGKLVCFMGRFSIAPMMLNIFGN